MHVSRTRSLYFLYSGSFLDVSAPVSEDTDQKISKSPLLNCKFRILISNWVYWIWVCSIMRGDERWLERPPVNFYLGPQDTLESALPIIFYFGCHGNCSSESWTKKIWAHAPLKNNKFHTLIMLQTNFISWKKIIHLLIDHDSLIYTKSAMTCMWTTALNIVNC